MSCTPWTGPELNSLFIPGTFKLQKPDRLIICIYLRPKSYIHNREYNLLSNWNH